MQRYGSWMCGVGRSSPIGGCWMPLVGGLIAAGTWIGGDAQGLSREQAREVGDLPHQAEQLKFLEVPRQGFAVHCAEFEPRLAGQGNIQQDLGEHAGAEGVLPFGGQLLANRALQGSLGGLRALQGVEGGIDPLQTAVLLQEVDGGLGTNPLHPRDVVGTVAGERLEINNILRGNAELGDHAFAADLHRAAVLGVGTTPHVEHGDVALVVHQLEQIPVAGKDAYPPASIGGPVCKGAEHIVGFVAGGQAEGEVEGLGEDPLQIAEVLEEVFRGFLAVGLVGRIGLVAEGGFGGIEGDHHALGVESAAVVEQGLEEPIGHAGGDPRLGAQPAIAALGEGIETAEGQGVAIHQEQQGLGATSRSCGAAAVREVPIGCPRSCGLTHRR